MNAPANIPAPRGDVRAPVRGLSHLEKTELLLGRADWSLDDYRRAGEREFDRTFTASRQPEPYERKAYAEAFVRLNCPVSKRRAA